MRHGRVNRRRDKLMERLHQNGRLILNADDWGRDRQTTDRIPECIVHKALSSASAMVFLEDSERAAEMARERRIDCGLHLNFTTYFSAPGTPMALLKRQHQFSVVLSRHRYAQVVFHPAIAVPLNTWQRSSSTNLRGCMARGRVASTVTIICTFVPDVNRWYLVKNDQTSTLSGPL